MRTRAVGASRGGLARAATRPVAGKWHNAGRVGFGMFFLAMAGVNTAVTLPRSVDTYRALADLSWPGFDRLVLDLVVPAAVPFTLLLIAFELGVAVLVLSQGLQVRVGLVAALGFMISLAPFTAWYELGNVPLAAWALLLLTRDYDRSVVEQVRLARTADNAGRGA